MAQINTFEDLKIWQESKELVKEVYFLTKEKTFSRDYQLIDHIRKTAISIPSNIAEGFERDGSKEFLNFLSIAKGSCGELRTQLNIALDQDYLSQEQFSKFNFKIIELSKSMGSLMKYLKSSDIKGHKFKKY